MWFWNILNIWQLFLTSITTIAVLKSKEYEKFEAIQYPFASEASYRTDESDKDILAWMWAVAIVFLFLVVVRIQIYNSLKNIGAQAFCHLITPCNRLQ